MTYDEQIAVLEAAKAGKNIERRSKKMDAWYTWFPADESLFNFFDNDYRVKAVPREIWAYENPDGTLTCPVYPMRSDRKAIKFVEVIE